MLKIVLASFPKQGRYVVNVKDVKDFHPKAADDFKKDKLYKVRWEAKKTGDSNSPAAVQYYNAHILLVAACEKSLMEQAKRLNIRLPRGFKEKWEKEPAAPLEDSVEMAHKASKRTKKQVNLAMKKACKDRMTEILRANQAGNVIPQSSSDNDNTQEREAPSASTSESQPQTVDAIVNQGGTGKDSSALKFNIKHASVDKIVAEKDHSEGAVSMDIEENEQKSLTLQNCKRKISFNDDDNQTKANEADNGIEVAGRTNDLTISPVNPSRTHSAPRAKKKRDNDKSDSDDDRSSLTSYVSSTSLLAKAQEEVINKQRLLTEERKTNAFLRRRCSAAELKLVMIKGKLKEMLQCLEDEPEQPEQGVEQLQDEAEIEHVDLDLFGTKASSGLSCKSPKKTPKKSPKGISPLKRSVKKSPRKTSHKSPKKKNKKESSANCDYQSHAVISTMILNDLEGKTPLQKDGQGQVHLGNGVWIRESLWSKLKNSKRSLSIVVQDLAENIWGFKRCAELSLTGGTSPKNPDPKPKDQAPADVVHAILGFYRAKIMQQGITVTAVLDNNVEKIGRGMLRAKFQNASKKWNREQKQAEKFADKELSKEDDKADDKEDDDRDDDEDDNEDK